jgi:thiol:disulfide interchange protein DsbC
MPNLYWVTFKEVPPLFISGDGQFLLQGELNKLGKGEVTNLTSALNALETKRQITSIPEKDLIIFSPKSKPKAVVYAFTDVDCGYCRKLHSEMNEINAKGIEVRYIAWPRSPDDVAHNKAVWCSEDRKAAMTTATAGLPVQAPACDDPILKSRQIGQIIGVNGTPAIYDVNGNHLGGYIPANDLAKILKVGGK